MHESSALQAMKSVHSRLKENSQRCQRFADIRPTRGVRPCESFADSGVSIIAQAAASEASNRGTAITRNVHLDIWRISLLAALDVDGGGCQTDRWRAAMEAYLERHTGKFSASMHGV